MELDRASRSTRGKRLKQAVEDEEQQADDQFWSQGFFAEEHVDDDYATEEEQEDVADSDFDDEEVRARGLPVHYSPLKLRTPLVFGGACRTEG